MRTKVFNALKVSLLALVLSFGLSYVYAWTAPSVAPTGGNALAPINVGEDPQTKAGGLTVASLDAGSGNISTIGDISGWNIVAGSLTTNFLRIPGTTAGSVLTSDASGNATWQTPVVADNVASYNNLPSGAVAGYCKTSSSGPGSPAIAPAAGSAGVCSGCLGGFNVIQTGFIGTSFIYSCIKI